MKMIPVEAILERDVDILLLEELNSGNEFLNWIIDLLLLPPLETVEGSWRSISAFNLGETDLLISYSSNSKRIFLLLENKIDADFQNEQQARYQQRGREYVISNRCDEYFCILVAPADYSSAQQEFKLTLSYEQVRDWFSSKNESRFDFKATLLEIAIEKQRRGYRAINHAAVQKFRHLYWEYKNLLLPELEMKKPAVVPKGNDWVQLSNKNLRSLNIKLWHKLERGDIDAQLRQYEQHQLDMIRSILPTNFSIERTGKSLSIRCKTVPLKRTEEFQGQAMSAQKAFEDIKTLNDWIEQNKIYLS